LQGLKYELCRIDIKDIDLNDFWYKISLSSDNIEFLAKSIEETGLINPPLVRLLNDRYIIVSGFQRIKACIFNNKNTISVCKIISGNDYQYLVNAITALSFQRQLTHAELIICIQRLNKFLDEKSIADKSAALFNTKLNAKFIKNLSDIANLPDPALKLIEQGNISLKTARKLLLLKKEIIKALLKIFSNIKASNNKQLEIIQYIIEISKRDSINPEVFCQNQKIQKVIFDHDKEPLLKTRLLREYLYDLRFPALSQTREITQNKINHLKLGNKIKLVPPDNFESMNYSLSFTAKSYKEFKKNTQTLNSVLESSQLKEIFQTVE